MASDSLGAPIAATPINLAGVLAASAPAIPAEPSPLLDSAALDALLDRITAIKNSHKLLEAELEPLLDQLDAAFEAGMVDPTFCHNDTSFCWSAGRTTYAYPEAIKQREQALKAAQKDAIASGAAIARTGQPFWTIRLPRH
jgi:hypothetical protein